MYDLRRCECFFFLVMQFYGYGKFNEWLYGREEDKKKGKWRNKVKNVFPHAYLRANYGRHFFSFFFIFSSLYAFSF